MLLYLDKTAEIKPRRLMYNSRLTIITANKAFTFRRRGFSAAMKNF